MAREVAESVGASGYAADGSAIGAAAAAHWQPAPGLEKKPIRKGPYW